MRRGVAVDLHRLHELDRQPVRVAARRGVELVDRLEEEGLAPLPVLQALEAHAAEDRLAAAVSPSPTASTIVRAPSEKPPRSKSARPRCATSSRRSRARMPRGIMLGARAACRSAPWARRSGMITRKPARRDPLGMAELDPVHLRVGEQAVEQDHRPAPRRARARPARRRRRRSSDARSARSLGQLAGRFHPAVDQRLVLVAAMLRQPARCRARRGGCSPRRNDAWARTATDRRSWRRSGPSCRCPR